MEREIFITQEINKDGASEIVRLLKEMEREGNYPIKFYINCYGGELAALFTVLDAMRTCPCEIITVNIGEADSAASLIFAAGSKGKRFCTENSRVMLHEVQISTLINGEPLSTVDARMEEWRICQERYLKELSALSGKSVEQVKKDITGKDLFLSAEEAIAYGLADKIMTLEDKELYHLSKLGGKTAAEGGAPDNTKERVMKTKEELLAALKADHGIDVSALKRETETLKTQLEAAKKENETLTASKTSLETKMAEAEKTAAEQAARLETAKKEHVFEGLVKAGKEFASMKEAVLKTFKTADELEAFYKDRPQVLHTDASGRDDGQHAMDELTAQNIKEGRFTKEEAEKYLNKGDE